MMSFNIPQERGLTWTYEKKIDLIRRYLASSTTLFPTRPYTKQQIKKLIELPDKSSVLETWAGEEFRSSSSNLATSDAFIPSLTNSWNVYDRDDAVHDLIGDIPDLSTRKARLAREELIVKLEQVHWTRYTKKFQNHVIYGIKDWPSDIVANLKPRSAITTRKMISVPSVAVDLATNYWSHPKSAAADFKNRIKAFVNMKVPLSGTINNYLSPLTFLSMFGPDTYGRSAWDSIARIARGIEGIQFKWFVIPWFLEDTETNQNGIWYTENSQAETHLMSYKTAGIQGKSIRDEFNSLTVNRMKIFSAVGIDSPNLWVQTDQIFTDD